MFFFFKQKTAYEMRISDWSSDVCSSDLAGKQQGGAGRLGNRRHIVHVVKQHLILDLHAFVGRCDVRENGGSAPDVYLAGEPEIERRRRPVQKLGRASCRERVCQYV